MATLISRFEKMPAFAQETRGASSFTQLAKDEEMQQVEGLDKRCLLLLDSRALDRECLARTLTTHGLGMEVGAFGSIDEWRAKQSNCPPVGAVLLNIGARKVADVAAEIAKLASEFRPVPVVVLSDIDDLSQILRVLECGARGYIPTSVGVEVCIEAIGLAIAGGIFLPASSVLAVRHLIETERPEAPPLAGMFTLRQAEVVQALRKGKANKIIAYELNLRESTVKVHIRNIMKKLKATNRTEVAYKLNDLFTGEAGYH
ncbi:response regulator transcription factor [Sinorhizobium americanum]|uniref:Two-component response regulator protein n=1 Tax=Sinorhizobium americanum TaxID=194963 RepID=A0A1L3LXZ3_9HYPH|nr:response regulator transcription factor [Sinorhizobium americanum]APG94979.1 two-component response regulator protein [Sinorhizobium americanum]OAP37133.1 helix-turn-helix transcriptional regulator [Sinorhizobium americanum]